ncbi:MAG: hypothetical protein K2Q01_04975, partial [Rickettsiales bacterium]|nr:hypothetical protein [Rickettsiales bacterium]
PVTLTAPVNVQATAVPPSEESLAQPLPNGLETLNEPALDLPSLESEETSTPENTQANTIEQVYNPERQQGEKGDKQSTMDDIKKRYEDILVIYMFLKQCGHIQSTDYNVITSSLAQEMASVNAPGRMQFDIVNSAKGSYQEIYSQSPCEGESISKLTQQYHQYIDILKTNFPPE